MKIWENVKTALIIVVGLWAIYLLDLVIPIDFRNWGIRPRTLSGLWGIIFAPLLHGGPRHLVANSGALLILLSISLSLSRGLTVWAVAFTALVGGLGVWAVGMPGTVHIGASGVIFGLIGFLLFLGIFRRDWKALGAALVVLFLYGGALLTILVVMPGVSWSGHACGLGAGVLAAWLIRKKNGKTSGAPPGSGTRP